MRTKKTLVQFGLFLVAGAIVAALAIGGPATSFGATPATGEDQCGVPMGCQASSSCIQENGGTVDTSVAGYSKSGGSQCGSLIGSGRLFNCGGYVVASTNCD